MKVIIDSSAGVCFGVRRALKMAEKELEEHELVSIGPIIHNPVETARLEKQGLSIIEQKKMENATNIDYLKKQPVIIRSHGISRQLMNKLQNADIEIVDATCPNVKKIQRIIEKHARVGDQVIVVGKPDHPEVKGLLGYSHGQGVVIQDEQDLRKVDVNKKSILLSQTTFTKELFAELKERLSEKIESLTIYDTTCNQLNKRRELLEGFSTQVDVIIVIGGKQSSNTKNVCRVCKHKNNNCYHIEKSSDIQKEWFEKHHIIGITSGASTAYWQLESVKDYIEKNVFHDVLNK